LVSGSLTLIRGVLMPGPGLDLIGAEEAKELMEVLESKNLSRYRFDDDGTSGPSKVFLFERACEEMTGARHCLGMNSCTSALLVGMWAAGIGPGDEVIVPGYTFVAPIAAIAYAGAVPILAEIDESLTIDPEDVRRKITSRTKAILVVHMLGVACQMETLQALAEEHDLVVLEDCAQAGGGRFRGRALGTFGTFGAFSLNVFKTFTAGDGGVLLTNDTALYERAFAIHDHGARPNRVGVIDANTVFGLNFRMHELTGAIAGAQLKKLPRILELLRRNKAKLRMAIGPLTNVSERRIYDEGGECATVLAYTFDSIQLAKAVASGLGTITLAESGKHNYANMPQLGRHALPFERLSGVCNSNSLAGSYDRGSLPRTDDLLARTLALSVGVVDSYLGTGFGINIRSSDSEIVRTADEFVRRVRMASEEIG
jgi:dTDP-4-amino-4,6-dideoxygalactose transaminase